MDGVPPELESLIRSVYQPAGLQLTSAPMVEDESADYGACRFELNGKSVVFRVAKTTQTKLGQFVTIWKRPVTSGAIAPIDSRDDVDFVVVAVSDADSGDHGQFIFSRIVLMSNGVMSKEGSGGKRGIRVYGPWVQPIVKSAIKAQKWQLPCFLGPAGSSGAEDQMEAIHRRFGLTTN